MNNYIPTNLITWMKWTNFLKDKNCQKLTGREIDHLNVPASIKKNEAITFQKRERQVQTGSLLTPTRDLRGEKNDTNSLQSLLENRSRGNTSSLILFGQHYPNTKIRQRHCKKEKL